MSEKKGIAPAPRWCEFKTVREILAALWKYMGANSHFGAWDTEPKYRVRDALEAFVQVPYTDSDWELYSTMKGVKKINVQIATAVNQVIALTVAQGFDAAALESVWTKVSSVY